MKKKALGKVPIVVISILLIMPFTAFGVVEINQPISEIGMGMEDCIIETGSPIIQEEGILDQCDLIGVPHDDAEANDVTNPANEGSEGSYTGISSSVDAFTIPTLHFNAAEIGTHVLIE